MSKKIELKIMMLNFHAHENQATLHYSLQFCVLISLILLVTWTVIFFNRKLISGTRVTGE